MHTRRLTPWIWSLALLLVLGTSVALALIILGRPPMDPSRVRDAFLVETPGTLTPREFWPQARPHLVREPGETWAEFTDRWRRAGLGVGASVADSSRGGIREIGGRLVQFPEDAYVREEIWDGDTITALLIVRGDSWIRVDQTTGEITEELLATGEESTFDFYLNAPPTPRRERPVWFSNSTDRPLTVFDRPGPTESEGYPLAPGETVEVTWPVGTAVGTAAGEAPTPRRLWARDAERAIIFCQSYTSADLEAREWHIEITPESLLARPVVTDGLLSC
jgi:hypothetical protein